MTRRSRPSVAAVGVALLLALTAACSDDEPASSSGTTDAPATTLEATTTSTDDEATTTTTVPEPAAIVLRGDGLGVVDLGATPDEAVAAVTAELGDPTVDTGWEPSFSTYGTCPGNEIRGVEWEGLVLLFTDEATPVGEGEHLFAWRITGAPPALGTALGFGYHATAADAEELYPGAVEEVAADDPFPAFLRIDAEGGVITAYLDDADVVTNLEAGVACGE